MRITHPPVDKLTIYRLETGVYWAEYRGEWFTIYQISQRTWEWYKDTQPTVGSPRLRTMAAVVDHLANHLAA